MMTQSVTNVQSVAQFATPVSVSRRPSRRPFTAVASCEKKAVARTAPSAVQQLLSAGAASALLLVKIMRRWSCTDLFPISEYSDFSLTRQQTSLYVQAQPAFANVNQVANISESSGPVEQLKDKFFGQQVRKHHSLQQPYAARNACASAQ